MVDTYGYVTEIPNLWGGVSPLAYLDTFLAANPGSVYWPFQETSGDVAGATNSALDLGRDVALNTYADYTAGANWANSSAQIARHAAGATATLQQDGILAVGKSFQVTITVANRTAGSVTVTDDDGGAISTNVTDDVRTISSSTGTDFIITPTSDFDGDIDVSILLVQQTNILASSAYPTPGDNPLDATHTGVTVGQPGPGGLLAVLYDGATSYTDAYSAELNSAFDPTAGTLMVVAKVANAGVWTDGTRDGAIYLLVDGDNFVLLRKSSTNNQFDFSYVAGSTATQVNKGGITDADWFLAVITWDTVADQIRAYWNGAQTGSTVTGIGTWAGNLTSVSTTIGTANNSPSFVWDGLLTIPALINGYAMTADEIAAYYNTLGI